MKCACSGLTGVSLFLIRIAPLLDEQGNLLKRYGVAIDIEDRKLVEEKLQRSQTQLAEAQRLAHVGVGLGLTPERHNLVDELYRISVFHQEE